MTLVIVAVINIDLTSTALKAGWTVACISASLEHLAGTAIVAGISITSINSVLTLWPVEACRTPTFVIKAGAGAVPEGGWQVACWGTHFFMFQHPFPHPGGAAITVQRVGRYVQMLESWHVLSDLL